MSGHPSYGRYRPPNVSRCGHLLPHIETSLRSRHRNDGIETLDEKLHHVTPIQTLDHIRPGRPLKRGRCGRPSLAIERGIAKATNGTDQSILGLVLIVFILESDPLHQLSCW